MFLVPPRTVAPVESLSVPGTRQEELPIHALNKTHKSLLKLSSVLSFPKEPLSP